MSTFNFRKFGYSQSSTVTALTTEQITDVLASSEITERLEKFAYSAQKIAPRSDDFLYFTIIFLKAAESALIDDKGNLKKVGRENAWGYFDENYKWHGNVKFHKNNNGDAFPEAELKKAARKWIGTPLCVDHKSDSVDGIRGIVLDTYYDEKLKQVVGLCALDKVNYGDLARKVSTGVVRYGSMGTGVEISICADCTNKAKTANEYCSHINQRTAYAEINIGLKPIEYSLVVQPAEPGAILLRTIASIKANGQELKNFGVDDLDTFTNNLTVTQATELDLILSKACDSQGCSISERQRIIIAFLKDNGLMKNAKDINDIKKGTDALADLARAKDSLNISTEKIDELTQEVINSLDNEARVNSGESFTSGQNSHGSSTLVTEDDQGVKDYTGTSSSGIMASDSGPIVDSFDTGGVGPESYAFKGASLKKSRNEISSIMGDIMKEANLRKRAEERRKNAYHQGGAAPAVEPKTYKSEDYRKYWESDKHMHPNPKSLGGDDGMVPGDKEVKEKLKRASNKTEQPVKTAYHQGGAAPAVEPKTYKSEDYRKYWDSDKHMHPNPKSLGGDDGMVPGDKEIKEKLKRASYNGPRLSTKFKKRVNLDGTINKAASCFEVYSGDKLVIAATAKEIMGQQLDKRWDWLSSQDYAKKVVAAIRADGLEKVAKKLIAQQMPEMPGAPAPAPAAPADAGVAPEANMGEMDMGGDLGDMDMGDLSLGDEDSDVGAPKEVVENALTDMEERISAIRSALEKLGGGEDVDINVNVGGEGEAEKVSLSRQVLRDLKVALAEAVESADELAKISNSLDKSAKLSKSLRADLVKVSKAALNDSRELIGETNTLLKMAMVVSKNMVKTSTFRETAKPAPKLKQPVKKASAKPEDDNSLVKAALELRRKRREALLKVAQEEEDAEHCADDSEEDLESDAHDGVGMKENAQVAGVAKDTARDVAERAAKAPAQHAASPSVGNADAKQHSQYPQTPARSVAEKSVTSVNSAKDAALDKFEKKEVKEIAKDKVKGHEEKLHKNDATDPLDEVKAKLTNSLFAKKAEEERNSYKIKVRRAYDLALEMQRKAMIGGTRSELDRQVDLMLEFDDKSFESFKRSVASVKSTPQVKTASLSDLNIGVGEKEAVEKTIDFSQQLANLWTGK